MKKSKLLILSLLAVSAIGLTSCGEAGPKGEKGDAGTPGEKGETGAPGKDGTNGSDGTSVLNGEGAPKDTLGKDGDSFIDYSSFDYYIKENGKWVKKGNIKGEKGNDGEQGPKGDTGAKGEQGDTGSSGSTGSKGPQGDTAWSNTILPCENGYIVPSVGSATKDTKVIFKMVPKDSSYKCISLKLNETVISADELKDGSDSTLGSYRYYDGDKAKMVEGGFVVSATFSTQKNSLTITSSTNGTVAKVDTSKENYFAGEKIKIKLTANETFVVTGLKVGENEFIPVSDATLDSDSKSYIFEVTMKEGGLTVEGQFAQGYKVSVVSDIRGGSVISDKTLAIKDDKVKFTIKADGNNIFKSLTINKTKVYEIKDNAKKGGTYEYTATMGEEAMTVSAEFNVQESITFDNFEHGKVTAEPTSYYSDDTGGKIKLTITPEDSYFLEKLEVNGVDKTSALTFTPVKIDSKVITCEVDKAVKGLKINATFTNDSSKSVSRVYEIHNATDLSAFRDTINKDNSFYNNSTIKLADDFGTNGVVDLNGAPWTPIKTEKADNNLIFDGNGKTITNFKIVDNKEKNTGFFGDATSLTIKNLTLSKADVTGLNHVGVLVGYGNYTTIEKCTVKDSTIFADASVNTGTTDNEDYNGDKVGAICGYLSSDKDTGAKINDCVVENVTLKGYRDMGTLVGYINKSETCNIAPEIKRNVIKGNISLINDRVTNDYKSGEYGYDDSKYDIGEIYGEKYSGYNLDSSNKNSEATYTKTVEFVKGFSKAVGKDGANVYTISDAKGLMYFAKYAKNVSGTVNITQDIDLSNEDWTPINLFVDDGLTSAPFTINGNGHKISNMKINKTIDASTSEVEPRCFGFIGKTQKSKLVIKDLTFYKAQIGETDAIYGSFGGVVIGYGYRNIELNNVKVTDSSLITKDDTKKAIRVGGLVGFIPDDGQNSLTLNGCEVTDTKITGFHSTGAMVGSLMAKGTVSITNCSAKNNTLVYRTTGYSTAGAYYFGTGTSGVIEYDLPTGSTFTHSGNKIYQNNTLVASD